MSRLIWLGVGCCLCALATRLFPRVSFDVGVDPAGAWALFAFGFFLILVGGFWANGAGRRGSAPADRGAEFDSIPGRVR